MDTRELVILTLTIGCVFSAEWGYSGSAGPTKWESTYPECGNTAQSPINIFEGDVVANGVSTPFQMSNYDQTSDLAMTLSNNGHTAVISLGGTLQAEISGGGLPNTFRAAQFHFHWGASNTKGSEHFINNKAYPMELHIVHYNTKYSTIGEAVDKSDGLAVLGFMFEVSSSDNANYKYIVDGLEDVEEKDTSKSIIPVSLNSLLPSTYSNFYRYQGSLTTPACYESVTWTVFSETIKISQSQLDAFREIEDYKDGPLLDNYRPIQPLNGRVVQSSFDSGVHWSYDYGKASVDNWPKFYESCGAQKQSPLNIPTAYTTLNEGLGNLNYKSYDNTAGVTMTLKNNGHTVQMDISGGSQAISGGGLSEDYNVAQFHLHWGSTSMRGSEHATDSNTYPMELHIVHYKKSLGSLGSAATTPKGLAVVGIFFEISSSDNPNLEPIISKLTNINSPKTNVAVDAFALDTLMPSNRDQFYRYDGSLTTPGCYESVIWTVLHNTVTVSESQMKRLRVVKSSDKNKATGAYYPMVNNFRHVQTLNTRQIISNFQPPKTVSKSWGYNGAKAAAYWQNDYPACINHEKSRQSPVDIQPSTVTYDNSFSDFAFQGFDTTDGVSMSVINNGHTVVVEYTDGHPTVYGGGLMDPHKVAQLHFHWGADASGGSEHTINGGTFPMEMHIVTYNTIYSHIGIAMTQSNGLAVLGFMFQVDDEDNTNFNTLINAFPNVTQPKTSSYLPAFTLRSLIPSDLKAFYRYDGSLTTPGCHESVTWTVFRNKIPISNAQLNTFRSLKSSEVNDQFQPISLVDNFRPPQPLNSRVVRANFYIGVSAGTNVVPTAAFTLLPLALGLILTTSSIGQ